MHKLEKFALSMLGVTLALIIVLGYRLFTTDNIRPSFPEFVSCNGRVVTLQYRDMPDMWGVYYPLSNKIYIEPNLPLQFEQEVVLHEVMHCDQKPILDLGINVEKFKDEEYKLSPDDWLKITTPELIQTLRDNPLLVRYLTYK